MTQRQLDEAFSEYGRVFCYGHQIGNMSIMSIMAFGSRFILLTDNSGVNGDKSQYTFSQIQISSKHGFVNPVLPAYRQFNHFFISPIFIDV